VFNMAQGQISFALQSRYSFAQRQATASSPRYAFDVRDGNGHQFFFLTEVISGSLIFTYMVQGTAQYYYVPAGTEDQLFGSGVSLNVGLQWNGSNMTLLLNGQAVKSTPYTAAAENWNASSNFDLGAYEYLTAGGYNVSDDVIGNFTVTALPSLSAGAAAAAIRSSQPAL
jgi:hypothetical protein